MKDKKVYTPTHLDLRPIQNISPIEGETEAEFKNYIYNHANKQLIIDFIKSNKKVILPNHTTTNNLLKNFPANTIINLYSNKKESIKNHRGWPPTPRALSEKYYWEPHNHPNILNISKEKLFFSSVKPNHNTFEEKRYWRGPVWINSNWIIYQGLKDKDKDFAKVLKNKTLELLEKKKFHEYYNHINGETLGANNFSWSAALYLDLKLTN